MKESTKQDLKRKISSRKFWALCSGLTGAIVLFIYAVIQGGDIVGTISSVVLATGSVVSYIIGEAAIDAAEKKEDKP